MKDIKTSFRDFVLSALVLIILFGVFCGFKFEELHKKGEGFYFHISSIILGSNAVLSVYFLFLLIGALLGLLLYYDDKSRRRR